MNNTDRETMQSAQRALRPVKKLAKKAGKKAGKALLMLLGPYLPFILVFLLIFLLVLFIIGIVFSATPQGGLFTGPEKTEEDAQLEKHYRQIADKNNKRDKWLVPEESALDKTWFDVLNTDEIIKNYPWFKKPVLSERDIKDIASVADYLHFYEIENRDLSILADYYGKDRELLEKFGQIHSATVFHMLTFREDKTTDKFKEETGADFRPYLYYKQSEIKIVTVTETEDGTETDTEIIPIYLLVESNTLSGHTIYNYRWETTTTKSSKSKTTVTKEILMGETQILPNPWQRLDDWVKEKLEIQNEEEIEMARLSVWEAGIGYTTFSERLEWLFSGNVRKFLITESFIPPELMAYFSKASEYFGIPSWFLAALAYQESSFNPEAINNKTGAYGLFQLMPAEQKAVVDDLVKNYSELLPQVLKDLYNTSNKDEVFYQQAVNDPWINTLGGCLVFTAKANRLNIKSIDWESPAWENQVLPILASYGGYSYVPRDLWNKYKVSSEEESRYKDKVLAWCKDEYASKIYNLTERFKVTKVLPIDGISFAAQEKGGDITSFFGERIHPITKQKSYHNGIDIAALTGTPVRAVTNARVNFAGWKDDISGNTVIISNGRYILSYCHLSEVKVSSGQDVASGQTLGKVGNTGRSTGPHLHFGVRDAVSNCLIDPLIWLTTSM